MVFYEGDCSLIWTTHVRGVSSASFWWQHEVSLRQNMICLWADVICLVQLEHGKLLSRKRICSIPDRFDLRSLMNDIHRFFSIDDSEEDLLLEGYSMMWMKICRHKFREGEKFVIKDIIIVFFFFFSWLTNHSSLEIFSLSSFSFHQLSTSKREKKREREREREREENSWRLVQYIIFNRSHLSLLCIKSQAELININTVNKELSAQDPLRLVRIIIIFFDALHWSYLRMKIFSIDLQVCSFHLSLYRENWLMDCLLETRVSVLYISSLRSFITLSMIASISSIFFSVEHSYLSMLNI